MTLTDQPRSSVRMAAPSAPPADLPARFAAALVGGVLLGLWRPRERRSAPIAVTGALLAGYAVRRALASGFVAAGLDRQRVSLRLALDVARPVHDVFAFFRDFENFPQLLGDLHSVTDFQDGRSRWEVSDRRGNVVSWDAVVTKFLPNSVLAWQSVPGSPVSSCGTIRFSPRPVGTHLDIAFEYRPLHGNVREAVRAFLAPRTAPQIEAHLSRAPVVIENVPVEAAVDD